MKLVSILILRKLSTAGTDDVTPAGRPPPIPGVSYADGTDPKTAKR